MMNQEHTNIDESEEHPIIFIEKEETSMLEENHSKKSFFEGLILGLILLVIILFVYFSFIKEEDRIKELDIPVSVTVNSNMRKLELQSKLKTTSHPAVSVTNENIMNVEMNMYEIHDLQAELTFKKPDTLDQDVYLFCRSADYEKNGSYLGTIVMQGKLIKADMRKRYGYCAMLNGNIVIGSSSQDEICEAIAEQEGSFFRQQLLLSDGEIPHEFYLHGKVERRALARKIDDKDVDHLVLVETVNKETLFDFANALRDYGFIDAIYITGGKDYGFYRDSTGIVHTMGSYLLLHDESIQVPWLVFRAK